LSALDASLLTQSVAIAFTTDIKKREAKMVSVDHFGQEIRALMSRANAQRATEILINGNELCRALRGDSASMDACHKAMRAALKPGDTVIVDEAAGVGMTVRYLLPR
jgi:hypothetical protein